MRKKNDMDSDLVLEVPDTPDRLAIRHLVDGSSKPWEREDFSAGVNSSSPLRNPETTNNNYACRWKGPSLPNAARTPPEGTDYYFRQAGLAMQLPDPVGTRSSSQPQSEPLGVERHMVSNESGSSNDLSQENPFPLIHPTRCRDSRRKIGGHPEIKVSGGSRDKGKGIDLCDDSSVVLKSRDNGCLSPCNSERRTLQSEVLCKNVPTTIDEEACSFAEMSARDKGKGIGFSGHLESNTGLPLHAQRTRQRRLVRNGCISPCNIEKGKNAVKSKEAEFGNMAFKRKPNVIPSNQIHIISPDSKGSYAEKKKGKVVVDDIVAAKEQHARDKPWSNRICSFPGKEVNAIADAGADTDRSEDIGWRTTHNHIKKASSFSSHENASGSTFGRPSSQNRETTLGNRTYVNVHENPGITAHRSNVTPVQETPELDSETRSLRGKRKFSSTCSDTSEGTSSTFENLDISYVRSSMQSSDPRLSRSRRSHRNGIMLQPVIEVDELHSPELLHRNSPEQGCIVSDSSTVRARQVELDEMLARQLQEQFYNDTPGVGGLEEIDANIALSLLQEDGPHASFARQSRSHHRDTSVSSGRPRFRRSSVRTTRSRLPTSNRMTQLRRNMNRPVMDLETRLNFLEALEAAFDGGNVTATSNHILRFQGDFNENDYEMLLALDDNNHQHVGASESQINTLPQSVIQNDNSEETCAVCLEPPSIGDTIRHLPCLHKFHKECIDTWLRRRMSCPICKSGIT